MGEGNPNNLVEFARQIKNQNLTGKEIKKKLGRFLESQARERGIPLHGIFELTPLCNLDCRMCYIHLNESYFDPNQLLSANIWQIIMEQAYLAGMRKATLTGGECLTYTGFEQVFLFLKKLGVDVGILSNGVLIDSKRLDFFKSHRPEYIKISLYGSNEETYEKVTGDKWFGKVYNNLLAIRDSGLKVQVSITPSRFMLDDMRPLVELVHSLNIPYEINCRLISPRENTGRETEDLTIDQYLDLYRIRAELNQQNLAPIDYEELPDEKREGAARYGLRCGAGRSSFAVNYEGRMMACVALDEKSVSILDVGFEEAWTQIKRYAENYPIPCECVGCVYEQICIHCQGQHKNAPSGHCDTVICERTKRLAEAGFYHYIGKNHEM